MELLSVLGILYAGVNLVAFAAFLLDKFKAQNNLWRIPEKTLLGLTVFGPFGALAAMVVFRHKTRHGTFLLVPFVAVVHVVLIVWLSQSQLH